MKKERQKFAQGFDHEVYFRKNSPDSQQPTWILKVPHGLNLWLTLLDPQAKVAHLRSELKMMENLSKKTGIRIPRTRIFRTQRAYIIAQQYLPADPHGNVVDALANIPQEDLHNYDDQPSNFIISQGILYSIDPFSSLFSRLSHKISPLLHSPYRKAVKWFRSIKRRISKLTI